MCVSVCVNTTKKKQYYDRRTLCLGFTLLGQCESLAPVPFRLFYCDLLNAALAIRAGFLASSSS